MKKSISDRIKAILLSSVLIPSLMVSSMSLPVIADGYGEQGVGVIFAYGGDHGDITLQGGWHKAASGNRFAIFYTTADRQVMYCLEPGNHRDDDSSAFRQDPDYIRTHLSSRFLSGSQIEEFMSLIMTYGYNGSIDGGQFVIDLGPFNEPITAAGGTTTTQLYEACQILIWETLTGERDANFDYVAPDPGYTPARSIHTTGGDSGAAFDMYYDHIVSYVKTHCGTPSFMVTSVDAAFSMEKTKPSEDGAFHFEDTSDKTSMSDWSFEVVDAAGVGIIGSTVTVEGESVTVTLPEDITEAYLRANSNVSTRGAVAWSSDGNWAVGSDTQDLVQLSVGSSKVCYTKIGRNTGSVTVTKTSDYGVVEGIEFEVIRTDTGVSMGTMTTDANGVASMGGLLYGDYTVEERSPERTVCIWDGGNTFTVTGSELDHSLTASNHVSTSILLHKTDKVTGEDVGYVSYAIYNDTNGNGVPEEDELVDEKRDNDGDSYIEFTELPVGTYLLLETEASGNYELSSEIMTVTVDGPQVYDITCTNDAHGSVTLTKTDSEDTDKLLTGAMFAIYVDTNANGTYESDVDTIYSVIADNDHDGVYTEEGLPRQRYLITEIVSPAGYEIDPGYYPFEITISDLDVVVSNDPYGHFSDTNGVGETEFMDYASGSGDTATLSEETVLTDHVYYQGLIPGKEYELILTLMDKDTGEMIEGISETASFIPEEENGETTISVIVDSYELSGHTVVAYETLKRDDQIVGVHADINDERQTIRFPQIGTVATGADRSSKTVTGTTTTGIVDTIMFENLTPGKTYRAEGILMNPVTGEEFKIEDQTVTGSSEFVPQEESGSVEVLFNFDATAYEGDVVIYEEVFDTETNRKVAEHKDITYRGQTVTIRKALVQIDVRPTRVISALVAVPPTVPETVVENIPEVVPQAVQEAIPQTGEAATYYKLIGLILGFTSLAAYLTYKMRYRKEK